MQLIAITMNMPLKLSLFILLFVCLANSSVKATIYETVQSGNFSSSSTWKNGVVPPSTFGAADTVIIDQLHKVTFDMSVSMDDTTAAMYIKSGGSLVDNSKHYLALKRGYWDRGINSIVKIDSLYYSGWMFNYSKLYGRDTVNKLTLSAAYIELRSPGEMVIRELLDIRDGQCVLVGKLILDSFYQKPPTIYFNNGGGLQYQTGSYYSINVLNQYSLKYGNANIAAPNKIINEQRLGTQIYSVVHDIEILNSADIVFSPRNNQLVVTGLFQLTSGKVKIGDDSLSSVELVFQEEGRFGTTGTGTFTGADNLNIYYGSSKVTNPGNLRFTTGANKLKSIAMCMDLTSSGMLTVQNDLTVKEEVDMCYGKINMGSHRLLANDFQGGGPDAYIQMDKSGTVGVHNAGAAEQFFPIGTNAGYYPLTINKTNNGNAIVSVENGVLSAGSSGGNLASTQPAVDATWHLLENTTCNKIQPG